MDQAAPRPAPIEDLPAELVRLVLAAVHDVASLRSAVLSCPLFYRAFLEAETSIAMLVLRNQIGAGVLSEAVAAYESSRLSQTPLEDRDIMGFGTRHLVERRAPPTSWSLQDALRLGRLHVCVSRLAAKFALAALTKHPVSRSKPSAAVTNQEICRIERALYRFETYCNLFRPSPTEESMEPARQKWLFFADFSAWENEQLGCVHDFLVELISLSFNDVAEHDVHWGVCGVPYIDEDNMPYLQRVLSFGLEKLSQIAEAATYEKRYQLLNVDRRPPLFLDSFLCEALQAANARNDNEVLDDATPDDWELHTKPHFADPDPGPKDIWRWAHYGETWDSWVYQENRRDLRQWGYVMWDRSRLEEIGVFDKPWEEIEESPEQLLSKEQEAGRQRAYMQNSWDQREAVSRGGGSGWWSWGDRSRVKWPEQNGAEQPGWRRGPSVPASRQPGSLAEARDMLTTMKLPPPLR